MILDGWIYKEIEVVIYCSNICVDGDIREGSWIALGLNMTFGRWK